MGEKDEIGLSWNVGTLESWNVGYESEKHEIASPAFQWGRNENMKNGKT